MRIAFICKRMYMGKDVVRDRYARLYEIPFQLAQHGHEVLGICLGYRAEERICSTEHPGRGVLRWQTFSLGPHVWQGVPSYFRNLTTLLRDFKPCLLYGASDMPHAVLTRWMANAHRLPYAIDLYDNFESYGQARIPGLVPLFRAAVRNAGIVTCVSEPLSRRVRAEYAARGRVVTMESVVDRKLFHPRPRLECRARLGLPRDAALIGTAGGLTAEKGIPTLLSAFEQLARQNVSAHLVLAGVRDPNLSLPDHPRVHYLGQLPHASVRDLFCALDVGVICINDSEFGRYSFPQKAYEMLACGIPIVAADVGAVGSLLQDHPESLYPSGDATALAQRLEAQLARPTVADVPLRDWGEVVSGLEPLLVEVAAGARDQA
jgi:glycosyltransferase involved in cell wall biosynthesis